VILLALTGGIGSGKSSVSARLAQRGAVIVDADLITHELQQPGGAVLASMIERWGPDIVGPDGALRRQAVADIVFGNPDELRALNKIVHPAVRQEMNRRARELADSGRVVVMDIPLLVEGRRAGRPRFSGVVVVDLPPEVAVERLVRYRGFGEVDAWSRIERQASREDRLAAADFVVDNSGEPGALDEQVDRLWAWAQEREQVPAPGCRDHEDRPAEG
jgi:dephospho-CoA kinase